MYSSLETMIYLFLILTMMTSTITGLQNKTFKKVAFANGTSVCSVDSPSKIVYLWNIGLSVTSEASAAAKGCIPPSVLCSYECLKDQNCTSYNYDDKESACQLFDYAPINFKISTTCEYHQVLIFTPPIEMTELTHDLNIKLRLKQT